MINCEVGHVYADCLNKQELNKGILKFKKSDLYNKPSYLTILIDDYNVVSCLDNLESRIKKIFHEQELDVDCYYESEMVRYTDIVFDFFRNYIKREFFKKQKKWAYFLCIKDKKIKLKEVYSDGSVKYSCICLSVIWHLKRQYNMGDILLNNKENIIPIYSVLSCKYKSIEQKVELILNCMGFNISYIFY